MTSYYMINVTFSQPNSVGRTWVESQKPVAPFDIQMKVHNVLGMVSLSSLSNSLKYTQATKCLICF